MKVRYEFLTGEVSEIEVEENLGELLVDLDRQQYNNDHKETRRHTSLDGMGYEGEFFVSDADTAGEVEWREDIARLFAAMDRLNPEQRELLLKVYFKGQSCVSIAEVEGVDKSAISHRLERIYRKMKKILK